MQARLGIIGSSGGSAIAAAEACITRSGHSAAFTVLTDRPCGLADWAAGRNFRTHRVSFEDKSQFSREAAELFARDGCREILLFFTRLVAEPLIGSFRVCNIHPSLLPAFRGFRAVEKTLEAKAGILGATLHLVDEGADTGDILFQAAAPLPQGTSPERAHRMSFLQKVWLTLLWFERACGETPGDPVVRSEGAGVVISNASVRDPALAMAYDEWEISLESGGGP